MSLRTHVGDLSFFDGVPAEDLVRLLGSLERRTYHAGSILIAEGDRTGEIYIPQSGRPIRPIEAYPPLVVDAKTILTFAVTLECFEAVSGQCCQICQRYSRLKTVELQARRALNSGKGFDPFPGRKILGPLIPIAGDHSSAYATLCVTSSITT